MSKVICVDALIYWGSAILPEVNDITIAWSIDSVTIHPLVSSLNQMYSLKYPLLWKNWEVSTNAYYDDSNTSIQDAIQEGDVKQLVIYPTRSIDTAFWYGDACLTTLNHTIESEDYSALDLLFTGDSELTYIVSTQSIDTESDLPILTELDRQVVLE